MTNQEKKALVRRFISEIFEQGRLEAVDELCVEDVIGHTPSCPLCARSAQR